MKTSSSSDSQPWKPVPGEQLHQLGSHLIANKMLETEAFVRVREEARRILGQCLPPASGPAQRTGLVVGYVQSGKTMSMATLAALARDNDFRLIIAFSGTTTNLFDQSRQRFERDLRWSEVGHRNWLILANPRVSANQRELARTVEEWRSTVVPREDQLALFIVVMKHHQRLADLAELLGAVDLRGVNTLIIDDEADQAGLDTRPKGPNPSTTYRCIREVRSKLPRHTYVQYTATPQAPLLISLADMLSPEFADVLQPGEGYTGGATFFRKESGLVCAIPAEDLLAQEDQHSPPKSLLEALQVFFVGVAAAMVDPRGEKYRSMLVHPSRLTSPHVQYALWVNRVTDRWRSVLKLKEGEPERTALIKELSKAYRALSRTDERLPPFDELLAKMPIAAYRLNVTEVNSDTGHEVDWNKGPYHILIGGQKLDRGYTVRGLTVSYMPRPAGSWNADTIQQRARFFGYKQRYIGFCRVYLPEDLISAYRSYVEHEENVRAQLRDFRGRPLKDWRRAFYLDPRYKPTRNNVLVDPYYRFQGGSRWFEQAAPHFSQEAVTGNRALVERFLGSLPLEPLPAFPLRHRVARNVPLKRLLDELLAEYIFLGPHDAPGSVAMLCRLTDHLANNPRAHCTVVQMDATRPPRKRSPGKDANHVDLQQGRDPSSGGKNYPGDAAIRDAEVVTVQFYCLRVESRQEDGSVDLMDQVPALAVFVPPSLSAPPLLVQPKEAGTSRRSPRLDASALDLPAQRKPQRPEPEVGGAETAVRRRANRGKRRTGR